MLEDTVRTEKLEQDDACKPRPFSEVEIVEHAWMQVLATRDVSAMSPGTKFCDELGYGYMPAVYFMQIKTELGSTPTKMLNGESRANCGSGKSSKFYHEPLTTGMSKCMCIAKNRKQTERRLVPKASQEARSQAT